MSFTLFILKGQNMRFYLVVSFFFIYVFSCWAIVDFKTGMFTDNDYVYHISKHISALEKIYNNNNYEKVVPSIEPRIPKIIHQIWIGSEVPPQFKKIMETWKKIHPDWTYKLWTDEDIENFPFINRKAFDDSGNNKGLKSDIWRLEILYQYGGLYADTDFESIKPQDILHHCHDFYIGCLYDAIQNSTFASKPKHPILLNCLKALKKTKITSKCDALRTTGSYFLTKIVLKYIHSHPTDNKICVYPISFFYPFPGRLRHNYWQGKIPREVLESYFTKETFSVHLWATSWQ